MNKLILLLFMGLPLFAKAHCPIAIDVAGETYCATVQWLKGETKLRGQYEPSDKLSPQLVLMGEVPQRWVYSKARFQLWKKGDHSHVSQKIDGFKIFPYMTMSNGHHHSTSYNFAWNEESEEYEMSTMAFQQMPGCWSFRWSVNGSEQISESRHLMNIESYENLTDDENQIASGYCSGEGADGDHSHHH